jgi:hypothetical protein
MLFCLWDCKASLGPCAFQFCKSTPPGLPTEEEQVPLSLSGYGSVADPSRITNKGELMTYPVYRNPQGLHLTGGLPSYVRSSKSIL